MDARSQPFSPQPGDRVDLFGRTLTVQPHPANPSFAFSSEGQRATVYQLRAEDGREILALKVFKKRYREPELAQGFGRLAKLRRLPGMRAAQREIISSSDPVLSLYPDLEYSMLMPWIQGKTWYDLLVSARKTGVHLDMTSAVRLCEQFLRVMGALEASGIAHTDISPGNVTIEMADSGVQLLDLEDAYIPGSPPPRFQNMGSAGYRHASAGQVSFWRPDGDRYSAAVLAAEMLVLSNPDLASDSTDEGYFIGDYRSDAANQRRSRAEPWLHSISPEFTQFFQQAWWAKDLSACPELKKLHTAILPASANLTRGSGSVTLIQPAPPPAPPQPPAPPVSPQPVKAATGNLGCFIAILILALVMLAVPGLNYLSAGCLLPVLFFVALGWGISQIKK